MRRIAALAALMAVLLTPTSAAASSGFGPYGDWSLARQLISRVMQTLGGLGRQALRPPAPVKIPGQDPIFGLLPSPQWLRRLVDQGHAVQVIEAIRRHGFERHQQTGAEYTGIRKVAWQRLLSAPTLDADTLSALVEDARTPQELAAVPNYITQRKLDQRDWCTYQVMTRAQAKLRWLRRQQEQRQQPPTPPSRPPKAPAEKSPPLPATPAPGPSAPEPQEQPGQLARAVGWVVITLGGAAAAAREILMRLPPL